MTEKQAVIRIASYCSKSERSEYDVKKKLSVWSIDDQAINKIVICLRKEGFLDEERFCRSFIRDKYRFNKWGENKIRFELRKKQIPEAVISSSFRDLALDNEFEESLYKLLSSKAPSVKSKNEYEKRVKLFRFAAGKGYPPEMIQKCLEKLII